MERAIDDQREDRVGIDLNELQKVIAEIPTASPIVNGVVISIQDRLDELEDWCINVDEKIRVARNAITVWAQSHRNLGAGIPVPPLIDVAGFTSGLVGTAASKVVP